MYLPKLKGENTMIQNLSQLKKAINEKKRFEIVRHFKHPAFAGQIRKPNKLQTNAFYSVVDGQPEHEVSKANGGTGYRMPYGKAADWRFENDLCECKGIMIIRFID
jgi:hypothetical protein